MKKKSVFKLLQKFISIVVIITLLMNTMVSTGFANVFEGNEDYHDLLNTLQEDVAGDLQIVDEGNIFSENIDQIIAAKYAEILAKLETEIAALEAERLGLRNEHADLVNTSGTGATEFVMSGDDLGVIHTPGQVNNTIVMPANAQMAQRLAEGDTTRTDEDNVRALSRNEKAQQNINKKLLKKRNLYNKIKNNEGGIGTVYAITSLLFGNPWDKESENNELSGEEQAYYDGHKAEIEAFEEEYVSELYKKLKEKAGTDVLKYGYKLMPFVRGKSGGKWEIIKSDLNNEIMQYANRISDITDSKEWVNKSEYFIKMLPYIKPEIGEEKYGKILNMAHMKLTEEANKCKSDRRECDDFINLLAKESLFYLEGEESKYAYYISDGYHSGIQDVIKELARARSDYEDYIPVVTISLSTYLTLKNYEIVKNIIWVNDVAENEIRRYTPPINNGLDLMFASTWVDAYLSETNMKNYLTSFPAIEYLPSNKGEYVGENGKKENIWWDLGLMLKEDGSAKAEEILRDLIVDRRVSHSGPVISSADNRHFEPITISRDGRAYISGINLLKISALVNISNPPTEAATFASRIMNTTYGDLTLPEEKAIDIALSEKYPAIKDHATDRAVINTRGVNFKAAEEQTINNLRHRARIIDIAMIVVVALNVAGDVYNLVKGGYKLGVAIFKTFRASRMVSGSARQVRYIRANIKSIQYFRAWKANGRAWAMGLNGGRTIAPAPAERVINSTVARPQAVKTPTPKKGTPTGLLLEKDGNLFNIVADGKNGFRVGPKQPRPGVIQLERPTNLTATVSAGGSGSGGGAGAGSTSSEGLLGKVRKKGNLNSRQRRKLGVENKLQQESEISQQWRARAEQERIYELNKGDVYEAEIDAMEKARIDAISNYKPNNPFNKPYSQMNWLERFATNSDANIDYLWRNTREAFTGAAKNPGKTLTSVATFNVGEAPAVEARAFSNLQTEIVSNIGKSANKVSKVFSVSEAPINLYDPQQIAGTISMPRANNWAPRTTPFTRRTKFNFSTVKPFSAFRILPTDIGLVRQQKLQARRELISSAAAITAGIFASGMVTPDFSLPDISNLILASAPVLMASLPEIETRSTETLKSILFDNGYTEDNIRGFTRQQIIDLVAFFESTQSMREGTIREIDESFNPENFVKAQYDKPFNENIKQIRILFVNDNPEAQNSLKGKDFANVKIDYADSGNEAINILSRKSNKYDIVITDMVMPQGNGYELAKWVHENNLHIPVILSSTLSGTPEQLYQKYFDGYIVLDVQGETKVINYASNFLAQWKYYDPSKVSAPRQKPVDKRLNSIITVNTGKGDRNGVIMSLYGKKVVITAGNDLEQGTDGLEIKDFYGNSLGTGKVLYAVNKIVDEFPATYQNYAIITLNEDLPSNFRVFSPVVLNGQDFYYVTPGEISRVSRNQDDAATWYENTFTIDKNPSILNSKGGILLNSDGSRIVGFDVGHYEGQSSQIIKALNFRYDLPDEVKAELSGNNLSKEMFSFGKDQELQIDHNFDFSKQPLRISQNNSRPLNLGKYIFPAIGIGVALTMLLNGSTMPAALTLASMPFWGSVSSLNLTGDLSGLKPEIQKFVQSRRYFDREIFEGDALTPEQEVEMRRILGDKFYELWQRYYNNQDLVEYARENPKDIEELAKYSNRYETTLPTQTLSRFMGTNPLYVNTMREMTETFERDLKSGKSIEEAVMNMGKTMFLYHKKINQIRKFFEESEESNNVNWEHVETPSNYHLVNSLTEESDPSDFKSSKLGRLSDRVIFGILGDTPTRIITPFDENKYGEYWRDFQRVTNRPNTFKGVNLTTHTIKEMYFAPLNGAMIHPLGVEKDGFNNIEAAFKVIQEDYNILKPIIERAQKGENLSKEDIETAHKIIAEISYIFTNAKPLFRGSASANLVIVYALYHMLGINAPQVTTGRELDLSAFVLTADEYQKEWLNLFSEPFNVTNLQTQTLTENNAEKSVLQTIVKATPTDRNNVKRLWNAENNVKLYYKRTTEEEINRTEEFINLVTSDGFLDENSLVKLEYPKVVSKDLSDLPSEVAQYIRENTNRDFSYKDMITTAVNTSGFAYFKMMPEALPALKGKIITNAEWEQIVNLIQKLNNAGFYHTDLIHNLFFRRDDTGKLIITIIDFANTGNKRDMEYLDQIKRLFESRGIKEAPVLDDDFSDFVNPFLYNLPSWVFPAVVGGIGLTMALNGFSAPALTLAALPFFARPAFNFNDITSANPVKADRYSPADAYGVWELKNKYKDIVAYLKYTTIREIFRTIRFDRIVRRKKLQTKYPLIGLEYSKFISGRLSSLPKDIAASIEQNLPQIISSVRMGDERMFHPMIVTPANTSGFVFKSKVPQDISLFNEDSPIMEDYNKAVEEAIIALKGQPITNEEWDQILSLFMDLNAAGFYHTDLGSNLYFRRDNKGKLILTLIDFEYTHNDFENIDIATLESMRDKLETMGVKEKSYKDEDEMPQREKTIKTFIALRKDFNADVFKGQELSAEHAAKMKEILGKETYGLWQSFYNENLKQMSLTSPDKIAELAKYSAYYENTLPSQMQYRFPTTNPLYVYHMKEMTEGLESDLLAGKTMYEAIKDMGLKMYDHHKKQEQIKAYLSEMYTDPLSVSWGLIETPIRYMDEDKVSEGTHEAYSIGFGILETTDGSPYTEFTPDVSYSEYWEELLNATNRPESYKGVNLSRVWANEEWKYGSIMHPIGVEKNGFNNIEAAFKVMQEDYDNIKPLIERVQNGGKLNAGDIETLHRNIAEIVYIFSNAKPYYRGTAAGILNIVQALYNLAGIEVPPVKIGRALDLSAFALTPEEYIKEWKNLFKGDFKVTLIDNADNVPAKWIFSLDYKNTDSHVAYHNIVKALNLPAGFEELRAGYRGIALREYADLETMVKDRLLVSKTITKENKIYFASRVNDALDKATQRKFGHVPVLIKMRSQVAPNSNVYISFDKDIKAEDIDDILVWAYIDGKLGWWRPGVDINGEISLRPTDAIETVSAVQEESNFNLRSLLLPAIGVGLGLTMMLNGNIPSGLTLAFLPLISHNANQFFNSSQTLNLKTDIARAVPMSLWSDLVQLVDYKNKVRAYYKHTNQAEIDRTQLFGNIATEQDFAKKYPLITLKYPKILSTDIYSLPIGIAMEIKARYKENPFSRDMIMTAVDNSGYCLYKDKSQALPALKGKPITTEEWAQIVGLVQDFNAADFYHTDLGHNMFLMRDDTGKLIVTIVDFDNWGNEYDMRDLEIVREELESVGAKEKATAGNETKETAEALPVITNQTDIPAQALFTDEYKAKDIKYSYKDVDYIISLLPSDFEENDAIYRGMTLNKFDDLKRIFTSGLQVSRSNYNYIYFSREIETAIDYASEYEYGHLPVIIKMRKDYYHMMEPIVKYSSNIPASDIDEVIVWAQLDGKIGWWKAELNDAGKVVLNPTDNLQFVSQTENNDTPSTSFSKLTSWLLPAIGIGAGITMALKGDIASGLTLATLPLMAHNANKSSNSAPAIDLKKDIKSVTFMPRWVNLAELRGAGNRIKAYYKRVRHGEIHRTRIFDLAAQAEDIPNNYTIGIEYSKIISTDASSLPDEIQKSINEHFKRNMRTEEMIITAVNTSGYCLYKEDEDALPALQGKPITNEEWAQIIKFFSNINKASFYHTDLRHNLFFRRDNTGKLIITVIDFDVWEHGDDTKDLETIRKRLESIGAKEKDNTPKINNDISAEILFTEEYRNFYLDLDEEPSDFYLPFDFKERGYVYRGMPVYKYKDLQKLFTEGLPGSRTKNGGGEVFTTSSIGLAMEYTHKYEYGYVPVLLKIDRVPDIKVMRGVYTYRDIYPEEIADVLVWAPLNGKIGWWRAQLNKDGEVVLKPTTNMKTVNDPKTETFLPVLNYLLPAIGIGAGITMALNGSFGSGALMASFPLLAGFTGGFDLIKRNIRINRFTKTRENFTGLIFSGPALSEEESAKMKEILGADFFNLWQKYYNQKLKDFARQNPQEMDEIIKNSNRYETKLPSLKDSRFRGTNPLYTDIMQKTSDAFIQDITEGKNIEEAITHVGKMRYDYHQKIMRIENFMLEKIMAGPFFNWERVQNPNITVAFGELNNNVKGRGVIISRNNYSEYYDRVANSYKQDKVYKGVKLTFKDDNADSEDIRLIYPNGVNDDGINNNTAAFRELQKDYDQIKPLIEKRQNGYKLNAEEITSLHNTIADMCYILTNAVPFFHGSSSINLTMVYSLYDLAAIDAPQIKAGKSLDLEAFVSTPADYQANWLKFFDGKFKQTSVLKQTGNMQTVAPEVSSVGSLTKEETQNIGEIFGEDLFAFWQDYYNKLSLQQINDASSVNNFEANKITANNYGEYLDAMLKSPSDRENTFKDVKLSTVQKNKKEGYAIINQPAFDGKQKENFYNVLQNIWQSTLKPLIEQRREGANWNAYLRKRMDANIATIAYLFANVIPVEEESFSAVTALVYALYKTAGIEAAPVKDSRSLTLSAISKDYDDYVENFRNFFEGDFVNIDADANIQTSSIPAKMLFTQEYKNTPLFLDDPANMYNNLPPGFEEEGVFYRGRIFDENGYDKFKMMFTQGLSGENATHGHGMVFATDIVKMSIYPYSLRTQHGHIPVLVKIKANKNNIPVHAGSNEFTFQNILPEEISEILVWVQNKWYKAQVGNNGEVVLQPTDNMQTVEAPFKLKNYLIPAIIGGLGLTMMLNGNITSGLTLAAALPVLPSVNKPKIRNDDIRKFIAFRKKFDKNIFTGPKLTDEEAAKMKKILGADFFNLWQKYYRQKLKNYAAQNPEEAAELAKYSGRYESGLNSIIQYRFDGTNPLFFYIMKDWSDSFAQALADGKNIGDVITQTGQEMFEYHKKIHQIDAFLKEKKSPNEIKWSKVKRPEGYRYWNSKHNHDVGFGILRQPESANWGAAINNYSFYEYLLKALFTYRHPKDYKYKNVNLTYLERKDMNEQKVRLMYPPVYDEDAEPNIKNAFNVLQEDWENIKPITEKHQSGQALTKADIKLLHENIAEMSYIFTNVVPFYRGSSSMNLIMVYALYQLAGIDAPKVKNGIALDLEAFVTNPNQYKSKWLKLFDGEFVQTQNPINLKEDIIEAVPVETDQYSANSAYAVWQLKDALGNIKAYLKYTTQKEIERIRLFHKIVIKNGLQNKYSIGLEYPQVISTQLSSLPEKIVKDIITNMYDILPSARKGGERLKLPLIMTPINNTGFALKDKFSTSSAFDKYSAFRIYMATQEALKALKGQPITNEEWQQIEQLFDDLNDSDFYHGDLEHNLFFRRDDNGKLIIGLLDFETSDPLDRVCLDNIKMAFESMGVKEKAAQGNLDRHTSDVKIPAQNNILGYRMLQNMLPYIIPIGGLALSLMFQNTAAFGLSFAASFPFFGGLFKLNSVDAGQGTVSAKVLFTEEYKKKDLGITWKRIKELIDLLPEGFVEEGAIYRGMSFSKYSDFIDIFTKGLPNDRTFYKEGVFFSKAIKDAVEYATMFAFGNLPVLVKMYHEDSSGDKYISFADGVKAESISEVLVLAEINGKLGWWRAQLDPNGEVVLTPTDNMEIIQQEN